MEKVLVKILQKGRVLDETVKVMKQFYEKFSVKLGSRGFGSVFKGVLRDGRVVAVKRLDNTGQGAKEFLAELQEIDMKSHEEEVVKMIWLRMWCLNGDHTRRPSMSMAVKVSGRQLEIARELNEVRVQLWGPAVNVSTSWKINDDENFPVRTYFLDGSVARLILLKYDTRGLPSTIFPSFGFGFFCKMVGTDTFYLSVIMVDVDSEIIQENPLQVVWSANEDHPVGENATLKFSQGGNMILADAHGAVVWSSSSPGMLVAGMRIYKYGNLMLLNRTNGIVWQSFDHPVDTLLFGQILKVGQRPTSKISSSNFGRGFLQLAIDLLSISAFFEGGGKSVRYRSFTSAEPSRGFSSFRYVKFNDGNIMFYFQWENDIVEVPYLIPNIGSTGFFRLDDDRGLRVYNWTSDMGWKVIDVFLKGRNECQLSLKCGRYGVCKDEKCTCPRAVDGIYYFTEKNTPNSLGIGYRQATEKFSEKLGSGGFGSVFKGILRDGKTVAVKRLDNAGQGFISRDQSQVITIVRETLGYLAPEWLHSCVTVKADTYSFGVVVLEVVSGRRNLDYSRPEMDVHLLHFLQRKVEENRLIEIIDYCCKGMESHEEEVVKMIRLGMWCLNADPTRRPSMSMVVKTFPSPNCWSGRASSHQATSNRCEDITSQTCSAVSKNRLSRPIEAAESGEAMI
ncbi:hypothetical protein GIB67_040302 [Kingdonia uniflora]|uniref:Bulb-type lectin domain-containing protein n=1 Tax=Kingdonia uniflora TaxID=39325 RepID=A0A7J7MVR8_9MAGN|nr:hypothetical protein GIB67_040302 [Kingdonia uniflora]